MVEVEERERAWIKAASYENLLRRWRMAPSGDPVFEGKLGVYYAQEMNRKRDLLTLVEQIAISKSIGWEYIDNKH